MKAYYDHPTQVVFCEINEFEYNFDDCNLLGGIAYADRVICGCCGCTIPLDEIGFLFELPWCDISTEIGGDELHDSVVREQMKEAYDEYREDWEEN